MQELKNYFIGYLPQIEQLSIGFLKAALILIIGYYLSRFVANKIRKAIAKQDEILARFIGQVILSFCLL